MNLVPHLNAPAAIVGTTGSGKTYAAKGAVEALLAEGRRVIIIDPTGAWYGLRSGADGDQDGGFPVLIFGGDHADVPITDRNGDALAEELAQRDVQAIIDISEFTGGEKRRFLTPFLERLYAKNRSALHLVVDEADEIAAQRLADGEQRMFGAFDRIVRRGRIKGFRPLMITQRPAVIHKNVLSQIGTLIALKLTSPQDRKAIEEWVKGNADADQAKAVMASLPTLSRGEGWVWAPADAVLERTTFPAIRTFDSSRTPEIDETAVKPALTSVDVVGLRESLTSSTSDEGANLKRPAQSEIEAAEKRGYELGTKEGHKRGYREGWFAATAAITQAIAEVETPDAHWIGDPPPSSGGTPDFVSGNDSSNPSGAAKPKPKRPASTGDLSENPFYTTAMTIWPARATWPILAAMCGRKARGGHFNTIRKGLLEQGLLVESQGVVVPASPPDHGDAIPADLLEENLPEPARKMFVEIRQNPGHSVASLGASLQMQPRGGHWNTGMSLLRKSGLIVEDRGELWIEPSLERAS